MKKAIAIMGLTGAILASCSSEETTEVVVETAEYSLNTATSTLKWHGEENEQHFHDGTISFTKGSLTTEDGTPVNGEFTIDAASVKANTEGYPEAKMEYLSGHLKDTAFLFVAENPTIDVKTGAYKDGKLHTTITLLGVPVTQDVPVAITTTENGLNMKGDFSIDFAETGMKYITEPNPETGAPGAKSTFKFALDLNLDKK